MKCYFCKSKLSIIEKAILCKCANCFCSKHRLPENHTCTYDYKKDKVIVEGFKREKIIKITSDSS